MIVNYLMKFLSWLFVCSLNAALPQNNKQSVFYVKSNSGQSSRCRFT